MTEKRFAAAVASALLPGGTLANGVTPPPADQVLDAATLAAWLRSGKAGAAVAAIEREAGGAAAFVQATTDMRLAALKAAEARQPDEFRALAEGLLTLYYQHSAVLDAFGWRRAPPQPDGHILDQTDPRLFDRVAAGRPIWRRGE